MNTKGLEGTAKTVRALSMDAVQKANSGHPGLPMGCAELGSLMYGEVLTHTPKDPSWIDRDRFVLSAGHGSMLLYSLLHLCGYNVSRDDLASFRSVGSKTPGHPEYGVTEGVETTTGPLGAGISNSVGMAIAETMLAAQFNTPKHTVIDHYTYTLAGDGCMMEGISSEAASLAGHLGLGKLVVLYDSNKISIEGSTELAFTEDVAARYRAYGWQTLSGDAYDFDGMAELIEQAKGETDKPTLITLTSTIGKGSPNKAGTHGVHGAPLGEEEVKAARRELGIPENEDFYVAPEALKYFEERSASWDKEYERWNTTFAEWAAENPELKKLWDSYFSKGKAAGEIPVEADLPVYPEGESEATRKVSGAVLQELAEAVPNLVGGSADLAPSNNTALKQYSDYSKEDRAGRNMHFGVREHAMGGVINGMTIHGGLRVFGATFLVFSDYMRPALRLAALMKLPVIFIFTHDSIYIGEDGPTHQPVEHLAGLRSIPGMKVLRPAGPQETVEAWKIAMEHTEGPTCLILTRQKLPTLAKADVHWKESVRSGAYTVVEPEGSPEVVILATGSEVSLAVEAAKKSSKQVRVVSVMDKGAFDRMSRKEMEQLIPSGVRTVVAEAGVSGDWGLYVDNKEDLFTINRFGESGAGAEVAAHLGYTAEALAKLCDR
ncbi:MAG: transketolase [Spirochaetaceae bacterium]